MSGYERERPTSAVLARDVVADLGHPVATASFIGGSEPVQSFGSHESALVVSTTAETRPSSMAQLFRRLVQRHTGHAFPRTSRMGRLGEGGAAYVR